MPDDKADENEVFRQQQAAFNEQLRNAVVQMGQQVAELKQPPAAKPPTLDEYSQRNRKLLEKLVDDPASVLGDAVNIAAQKGYELARQELQKEMTANQRRQYFEQVTQRFYAGNPDLQPYDSWIAGLMGDMNPQAPVEEKLTQAAQAVRAHLAQRDAWAADERNRAYIQSLNASSPGGAAGSSAVAGPSHDDDVPMDELSLRRVMTEQQDAEQRARKQPLPRVGNARR